MLLAAIAYLNKYESLWRPFPVIVAIYEKLIRQRDEIINNIQLQEASNPTSERKQRDNDSDTLAVNFYRLSCRLLVYAQDKKNIALEHNTTITEAAMRKKRPQDLITACQNLLSFAEDHVAHTADYQITQEDLNQLKDELARFKKKPTDVVTIKSERKMATLTIKEQINETRLLLIKMDKALQGFIVNSSFLSGWEDARKIKGRSQPRKKEKETELQSLPESVEID
jgi:hypothetical protein